MSKSKLLFVEDKLKKLGTCFHCGDSVFNSEVKNEEKLFCCNGCKTVYEIINQNNLCSYYEIDKTPGVNQNRAHRKGKFDFLDNIPLTNQLVHFKQDNISHITFYLPQMHCNSCIWILEKLPTLDKGVFKSTVNFIKREVTIQFDNSKAKLSKIAEILTDIGYEPHISLNDVSGKSLKKVDTNRILKIGIAGFCFGNIMMFSFPEYFSLGKYDEPGFKYFFNYFNLLLSLPVFFYTASEFFVSAFKSYNQKYLNIDAPIALAIFITFSRSIYEILSNTGSGYLDSMSGIVFFMLIGRYLQNRTYQQISFERDFTSYFPLGVTRIDSHNKETQISVKELKIGDRIKIFNEEIIPADAILFLGRAIIDYSFVTGEASPISKNIGEIVYAGGRQTNGAIELEVVKEVSQSYLTQLWNNEAFDKSLTNRSKSIVDGISKYFTVILFSVTLITAIYWHLVNPSVTLNAITSILIVACPCALLLSATFTNGSMIQQLNKSKFYIKNSSVLESISKVDTIVFDKTGTITVQQLSNIIYYGEELTVYQEELIFTLSSQSNHPLSKAVAKSLEGNKKYFINGYIEVLGEGISGFIDDKLIKFGSSKFVLNEAISYTNGSRIYVSINEAFLGYFEVSNKYRNQLKDVVKKLSPKFNLSILSGDNDGEREKLKDYFNSNIKMVFNQSPIDKLNYIKELQKEGKVVLMFGDGLNDAGALKQSDVGVAISDNMNNFSPSCDVIMAGENFNQISELIVFCKKQSIIIYSCFAVSIVYNFMGLYFAIIGELKPVIAAVLMPMSTISILFITLLMTSYFTSKMIKK